MKNEFDLALCVRDLLLLRLLQNGDLNGSQMRNELSAASNRVFTVAPGSLYLALHGLEGKGFVTSRTERSAQNHRVKIYRLTASGRKHLESECAQWELIADAVAMVLRERDRSLSKPALRVEQVA